MKVIILGAGVIGVTSAWYLAEAGHEVTVIERQPGPGLETSFANAGEISPGYASPWAGPGIPAKAIKWLLMKHPPLILRPALDMAMVRWVLAMLRNCTAGRYALNKGRMVEIAEYSRDALDDLRGRLALDFDHRAKGTLQLFRTERQVEASAKDIEVLRQYGVSYEQLDQDGCIRAEPGLAFSRDRFRGGLRLPGDQTGDCRMFTEQLARHAAQAGVDFRYGVTASRLVAEGGRLSAVETDAGRMAGDAFVVALGSHSPALVRPHGVRLPVYPVKGYSITVPIVDASRAPESTLLDETYKIAITRLGHRIRVGGMAELSGYNNELPPGRRDTLSHCVEDLFPGAGDVSAADYWSGLRPMTPDGPPVLGRAGLPNLYLNTGHGTLGWTMACGSGRVIADLVSGKTPPVDPSGLSIARYRG